MGKYVTVSAKVPEDTKKKLRELNINTSQLVRKALEEEIKRREEEELKARAAKVSRLLKKIPPKEITKTIRETRIELRVRRKQHPDPNKQTAGQSHRHHKRKHDHITCIL